VIVSKLTILMRYILFTILCFLVVTAIAQDADSYIKLGSEIPSNYYSKVDKKIYGINEQLAKKSLKYLAKFQRLEQKFQQKSISILLSQYKLLFVNPSYYATKRLFL